MSLNSVPSSERAHIGFFGKRNSGKSSLINKITGQGVSVVSPVAGTTTDLVKKSMELLPIGPVVLIDTPGFDDEGELGLLRVEKARSALAECDAAVLVVDPEMTENEVDKAFIQLFNEKNVPYLSVFSKSDLKKSAGLCVSSVTGEGTDELLSALSQILLKSKNNRRIIGDLLAPGDNVILVTPIDSSAPKGRLILPQVQTLRDVLDSGASATVVREHEYKSVLSAFSRPPKMVITDSQVFKKINAETPHSVPLTSFSVLMARYKGTLLSAISGADRLNSLSDGDKILIAEACTHKKQCNDIGTSKLPAWISSYTKKQIEFSFASGKDFPGNLSEYALIIQCGGCMLTEHEVKTRYDAAEQSGVPITNYGTAIAQLNGILQRATELFVE